MAGRLSFLGSSVPARSLNFPSFYASSCQCRLVRSSKCRVRRKKLACLCMKPTSFGLVSTSERSDGSIVFHFGDASEMPEDDPPVEASVHFESSEEKVRNVDLFNEGAESFVRLEDTEGDHEQEGNSEGSLIHALTEAVGSEAVDACSGDFPEKVDDQLVLSGNTDQWGDSHLAAGAATKGIDLGNGPFEETQLKSEASNCSASDLGIVENNNMHAEKDFIENSLVFLADDSVPVDDSNIIKNAVDTYLTIEGGSGVTSNADHAGDSLRLEKLDTITEDAAPTSIGFDTEIADAIERGEDHAKINISDIPNEVEEEADLNLPNQFLSGNSNHQFEIIPASNSLEVVPSPSEEARDGFLIDAHKKDVIITPAADDATSLNQEVAVENDKASTSFGVAVLLGHEEMLNETAVVKRKDTFEMELYLSSGVASLTHPSKESRGGEDAHFVHGNWLGIADGVGQWSMEGANASSYAQELLKNCVEILSSGKSNPMTDPVEVIVRGAAETHSSGLSTVTVASVDGQVLRVAGIGDSGFIIIRNGNVLEKSSPMLHEFNLPLQIHKGIDPSQLIKMYSVRLDEDDVIVLATNGLFDNLYEQEIALIASDCLRSCQGPNEISQLLARRAREVGISKTGGSPFADAAHAASYVGYTGGKLDDVTIIVSLVERNPGSRS